MEFLKEKSGLCANLEKQIAALTLQVMQEFSFFQLKFKVQIYMVSAQTSEYKYLDLIRENK